MNEQAFDIFNVFTSNWILILMLFDAISISI